MKRIYTATNLPDAHLLRNLLVQAGIAAHIFNENAMSAFGELPLASAYPEVWIAQPHQEQHARALVSAYTRPGPSAADRWCAACSEANPGEFELCWNCGAAL
jgi:hypothetical protein